jgi:hypothetical protein
MGLFGQYKTRKDDYGKDRTDFYPEPGRIVAFVALILIGLATLAAFGCPRYNVWEQGLKGQAELRRAEQNRQIKIQEAIATEESASHLAGAEVKRAEGVAAANKIIGQSLKENEDYLRWLWIEGLKEHQQFGSVIYIPTEAGMPILEAGRLQKLNQVQK